MQVHDRSQFTGRRYPVPAGRLFEQIRVEAGFVKEFVSAPFHVGSICPSSKALTETLIRMARVREDGLVVDLGAGSGIVTTELLKAGVPAERIVGVELSPGFSKTFSRLHPNVPILTGDARNLGSLLANSVVPQRIAAIISSLPFRVMPNLVVGEIVREIRSVLASWGGCLVQYTYAWWMSYPLRRYGLQPKGARVVFKNMPPAKVERYVAV
jgi:phospholipid N-methyltransferase